MERTAQSQNIRLPVHPDGTSLQGKLLRDQIHLEIESKVKICSNPTYECSIPRVEGSEYCIRHVLRDPRSNYKQCSFIYSNGKKCINAVPKHDTKKDPDLATMCFEHNRQMQVSKTRNHIGKLKRVETNESLLNNLTQHLKIESVEKQKRSDVDEEIDVVSPNVPPFINYEQIHDLKTVTNCIKKKKRILDYASDSSSDEDLPSMSNTARNHECDDSDNESVDSIDGDLIRHAGIYSQQETLLISESKLKKLQSLYVDQINRLHHLLKEKRRQYLYEIRKEREYLCSIHDQLKDTPQERLIYEKLKSLNHYHRRHGVEAILYKKFKEKRLRSSDAPLSKSTAYVKCIFTEGGVKCGEKALPCCRYCKKHILEDKRQVLFRACEVEKSGVVCQETVPCMFDDSTCVLHLEMPQKRQYIQKKYESETEEDDFELHFKKEQDDAPFKDDHVSSSVVHVTADVDDPMTDSTPSNDGDKNITISHDSSVPDKKIT